MEIRVSGAQIPVAAEKANASSGPVVFMLPLKGVSMLDPEGEIFYWPEANQAIFDAIKENVRADIPVIEMDVGINDPVFADRAVQELLGMLKK
ncbi:Tm-1-like ATP-binding domain-containing protein, partial [Candidatus Poribacteria bacterium]